MASIITVTDSKSGAKKSIFLAPAGLLATAQIAIESLLTARSAITLTADVAGQYIVTDASGAEMGRYTALAAQTVIEPRRHYTAQPHRSVAWADSQGVRRVGGITIITD